MPSSQWVHWDVNTRGGSKDFEYREAGVNLKYCHGTTYLDIKYLQGGLMKKNCI